MDDDQRYQAVLTRDHRFDGTFFVGVRTTGVYCRPICPARPQRRNVEFFSRGVDAEKAGYRPCLRCRPEAAPLSPAWYGKSALVQRVLRALEEGDPEGQVEEAFAARFGVGARQLRRLFTAETGRTPRRFAEDRRLDLARKLLVESDAAVTEIAYAAGFRSLRRFNEAFRTRFSRPPTALRRARRTPAGPGLRLSLSYRPPYDWSAVLAYLKRHEVPGIEEVGPASYLRRFKDDAGANAVLVENDAARSRLRISLDRFEGAGLPAILRALRRLFDLDADPLLVATALGRSPLLARQERRHPGMRAPGSWDPFETAVAIILGQLVSSAVARKLMGQLLRAYGEEVATPQGGFHRMPSPRALARCRLTAVSTTEGRRACIRALAARVAGGALSLHPHQGIAQVKAQLASIPGIGPWTVEYIGMRCLADPDSFPRTDRVLARVLKAEPGAVPAELSPWRAYAAYRLWRHGAETDPGTKGDGT